MKLLYVFILIASLIFNSCIDCEKERNEPILIIEPHGFSFTYASGLKQIKDFYNYYDNSIFPVSIASDTTTYIIHRTSDDALEIQDTLAISYKRHFYFESCYCGYKVFIDSIQVLDATSFDSVLIHSQKNSELNEHNIEIYKN